LVFHGCVFIVLTLFGYIYFIPPLEERQLLSLFFLHPLSVAMAQIYAIAGI
jgi:hypothetical protein